MGSIPAVANFSRKSDFLSLTFLPVDSTVNSITCWDVCTQWEHRRRTGVGEGEEAFCVTTVQMFVEDAKSFTFVSRPLSDWEEPRAE